MEITITLNGKTMTRSISPDTLLIDFVRSEHCLSVKRGCDTSNCGLCTVLLDNKPVLSCSVLAARAAGHEVTTLEGLQEKARPLAEFIADQGAEQCGFCNPGFMMNTIALLEENKNPSLRVFDVCCQQLTAAHGKACAHLPQCLQMHVNGTGAKLTAAGV